MRFPSLSPLEITFQNETYQNVKNQFLVFGKVSFFLEVFEFLVHLWILWHFSLDIPFGVWWTCLFQNFNQSTHSSCHASQRFQRTFPSFRDVPPYAIHNCSKLQLIAK